jgi:hypothetical protein
MYHPCGHGEIDLYAYSVKYSVNTETGKKIMPGIYTVFFKIFKL